MRRRRKRTNRHGVKLRSPYMMRVQTINRVPEYRWKAHVWSFPSEFRMLLPCDHAKRKKETHYKHIQYIKLWNHSGVTNMDHRQQKQVLARFFVPAFVHSCLQEKI